jgi:hypothetical protein
MNTRGIARCCETGCGERRARCEGPNHIISVHGVSAVSHDAPVELVRAMINAAADSCQIQHEAAA